MIIPLLAFKLLIWISIGASAFLMSLIFGYFIYELKKQSIW